LLPRRHPDPTKMSRRTPKPMSALSRRCKTRNPRARTPPRGLASEADRAGTKGVARGSLTPGPKSPPFPGNHTSHTPSDLAPTLRRGPYPSLPPVLCSSSEATIFKLSVLLALTDQNIHDAVGGVPLGRASPHNPPLWCRLVESRQDRDHRSELGPELGDRGRTGSADTPLPSPPVRHELKHTCQSTDAARHARATSRSCSHTHERQASPWLVHIVA